MTLQDMGIYSWVPVLFLFLGAVLGWLITSVVEHRKLARMEAHASDLYVKNKQAAADLDAANARLAELQASLDATNADLAGANARANATQLELDDLKQKHASLLGAQQSYGRLNSQVQTLQTELGRLAEENDSLKANIEDSTKELAKARMDLATATQTINNKDVALTEAYSRAVKLEHTASDEQGQLLSMQAEVASLKNHVARLTAANQDLDRRLQNARGEVAGELAVLTSTMLRVKDEQLAQANATVAALQAQMAATADHPVLA